MVSELRAALPSLGILLDREKDQLFWTDGKHTGDLLVCDNGILNLDSLAIDPLTPDLFTTNALPFAFDPTTPSPNTWHMFLSQLWPDDPASIFTLQVWFGYCLTPWTALQKMLLLVGPKRSGKGTIARVLNSSLGSRNVCGPTLGSLGTNFGLQSWLDKLLAVMSDARLSGRTDQSLVVENLLRVSGEDFISIDRKHKPAVQIQLPTRVMLISNELPRLSDTSGALAGRFITLKLTESFYGKEDTQLTDRLMEELPGILNWALEGRKRLKERGAFVQPDSAVDAMEEMADLASPVGAFVRDECLIGQGHTIRVDGLYQAWKTWCEDGGRDHPGTKQRFARDLRAAVPGLHTTQPRAAGGSRYRAFEGISRIE